MSNCGHQLEVGRSWKRQAGRAARRLARRLVMEFTDNDNGNNHDSRIGSTGSRELMLAVSAGADDDGDDSSCRLPEINERSCTPPPPYTQETLTPSAAESTPVDVHGCLSHVPVQPLSPPPYTEPLPAAPAVSTIQVTSALPPPPAYTGPALQDTDSTAALQDFTRSSGFRGNGYDSPAVVTINQPEQELSEQSFDPHCILACIAFWCGGCVLGLVSMIFVITAREKVRTSPQSAKRFACASVCLSLFSILLIVLTVTVVPITLAYINRKTD